jgi:hypothetical protein
MADAPDSKSGEGNLVWVRLPPPAPPPSLTGNPPESVRFTGTVRPSVVETLGIGKARRTAGPRTSASVVRVR